MANNEIKLPRGLLVGDWLIRLAKGAIIGIGFTVPGISGGVLAAVLGLYLRMISFVAQITKNFKKDLPFFIPVGIGAILGIIMVTFPLTFLLDNDNHKALVIWGFIGCIIGTMPALWKEAGKMGRRKKHYVILILTAVLSFVLLSHFKPDSAVSVAADIGFTTWIFAGILITLVCIIPGMSTSTFLLYFGLYRPLLAAVKPPFDIWVLLPVAIGIFCSLFPLSNLINMLLKRAYPSFFHFVVGIVISSTLMIIPAFNEYNYLHISALGCVATMFVGIVFGFGLGKLEEKQKEKMRLQYKIIDSAQTEEPADMDEGKSG